MTIGDAQTDDKPAVSASPIRCNGSGHRFSLRWLTSNARSAPVRTKGNGLGHVGKMAFYEFLEARGRGRHGPSLQAHDGQGSVEFLRIDLVGSQQRVVEERGARKNCDAYPTAYELRQGAVGVHGDGVVQPEPGIRRRTVKDPSQVRGRRNGDQRFASQVVEADFLVLGKAVVLVEDDMITSRAQFS